MSRVVTEIIEGWEFAREEGQEKQQEKRFRPVTLPHDWAVELPFDKEMAEGEAQGFHNRFGIGWYRKKLFLPCKQADVRYYLEFGGISENSTVWMNGQEAGGRKYGYSTFRLDVTELVKQGENLILVKVDNTCRPADRWYSGAGIYRTVKWLELDKRHLEDWEIILHQSHSGNRDSDRNGVGNKDFNPSAFIEIETGYKTENAPECSVHAILKESREGREWQAVADREGCIHFEIPSPRLWSAETPDLYTLELVLYEEGRICGPKRNPS